MAQEIDINLNVKTEQADKSLGSLKSQLKQAQQEVQTLADKYGATSLEAINAAKRAGELNDKIGDAKSLTEAFNPDAKFKSLTASLSGVAGGFAAYQGAMGLAGVESKDLEKQLLKVQSAMAIAQGLQGLGEARDSFKQLKAVAIDAFKGIKTAIGSTGIGLLVVAAGALYAYWDDIKAAVSGVSEEQKKLNAESKKNLAQEQEKLKAIGSQDEILKLQGKSEREILKMKVAQTDETIAASKIDLKRIETTNEQQQKAVELNYKYLKSFIDFISIPQRILFETGAKAINSIIDLINKIPGVEIKARIDEKFAEKASDYVAKLGFDPKEVREKGEQTVKEAKTSLDDLANDRARFQNQINDINKQAAKDAILTDEERKKKLDELDKQYNKPTDDSFDVSGLEALDASNQAKIDADLKYKDNLLSAEQQFQLTISQIQYDSQSEREARDEEARQRKIEAFQATTEALGSIAQSGEQLLSALQSTGLARGKVGQAAMKALALAQIASDSAIAFSKMMQGTEQSAAGAASGAPGPAAPAVYLATKIAFYASGTATILANIARAKKLLGGGGGGGGGSAGGGGGAVATAPTFNVVGQGGANQIAEGIGARDAQPLKAFVVGGDVTTQQSLNMGIVQNATLG